VKIRYNSPVILTYALLSAGVLLLGALMGPRVVTQFFSAPCYVDLSSPGFYLRLFSYVLGHAGWGHYIANLMLILLVGPLLEEKYGSRRLLVMVALTAVITSLSNLLLFHASVMGGSGIAFMLILLASFANIRKNEIPLTFLIVATLFLGQEVISSLRTDQVSQFSHLLGGFIGALFGLRGGG
jgi:membrane associated rhomboid family serine protease